MTEQQARIGCFILEEGDTTSKVSFDSLSGEPYELEVPKEQVTLMKLPFQSEVLPNNAGILECEIVEETDDKLVVKVKGEPADMAAHLEVPPESLARSL